MDIEDACANIFTHIVFFDIISDNMEPIVKTGKYGSINTADLTTIRYYVVKFLSNKVTMNLYNNTYGQVLKARGISVKL